MRFAILGGGAMPVKCLDRLRSEPGAEVSLVLADPARELERSSLYDAARALKIPSLRCPRIRDPQVVPALAEAGIDWLLSIHNHQILSPEILALPRCGTINLHNSALPRYGGLNACSWAILNGESSHGVTWHLVTPSIDAGDILAQASFPLAAATTAISVLLESMRRGLDLFDELLPRLMAGTAAAFPQKGEFSYYAAQALPFNGRFPLEAPYRVLERLSRAIDFHPLPNLFFRPRLRLGARAAEVDAFTMEPRRTDCPAGTILSVAGGTLALATEDAVAHIQRLVEDEGNPIDLAELAITSR